MVVVVGGHLIVSNRTKQQLPSEVYSMFILAQKSVNTSGKKQIIKSYHVYILKSFSIDVIETITVMFLKHHKRTVGPYVHRNEEGLN